MWRSGDWRFAVRALRSRNYRLFFGGQGISLIGTWMTRIATAWLVYRLTRSPLQLGLVSFAGQLPAFFLTALAGVWVDRWDRRRTLIVTQTLSMVESFALAALALSGVIKVWHVFALMLFQGLVNAFDTPARQAFVVQMVDDPADLSSAIALNSSIVNGARLAGPALAGIVIGAAGEGVCFLLDGFSYLAVIASLLAMMVAPLSPGAQHTKALRELAEGWRYVKASVPIRSILLLLAVVSLVGMPYTVLMPIFASQVLGGGPHTLGFLMAASGAGALAGAAVLALRRSVIGLTSVIAISAGLFGAGLVAFSSSRVFWLSCLLLLGTGFGFLQQIAASNTVIQTVVAEDKRGRVMAYYSMAFQGIAPFGSLLAGALAARVGAPRTLTVAGIVCIAAALLFARQLPALRRQVRPIYAEKGIVHAPAESA